MSSAAVLSLPVMRLPHGADLPLPEVATAGSAGMDLRCATKETLVLELMARYAVPTGIAIAVPEGWEAQVRARSGLAFRHGIGLVNGIGTIDSDYRGEIFVLLINLGANRFILERGERIAQLVLAPVVRVVWADVNALPSTKRGRGAFGSTGRGLDSSR